MSRQAQAKQERESTAANLSNGGPPPRKSHCTSARGEDGSDVSVVQQLPDCLYARTRTHTNRDTCQHTHKWTISLFRKSSHP